MNSKTPPTDWKSLLQGFALLVGCAAAVGYVLWHIWSSILALKTEYGTAIIAGMFTVFVSVGTIVWTHHKDRAKQIEQEHRQQVIPIYNEFIEFWFAALGADLLEKPSKSEKEMMQFFIGFTQKIILWGSDQVIAEYMAFRRTASWESPPGVSEEEAQRLKNIDLMIRFEKLLYAMRSDVGHRNTGLNHGDLFSLFVKDLDQVLPPSARTPIRSG